MDEFNQQSVVEEEGMTLQELFKIVWLNRVVISLIVLWVTVFGIIYTYVIVTPTYETETSLMVQVSTTDVSETSAINIGQDLIYTYQEFVVSNLVLNSTIEDVQGLPDDTTAASLENSISISTSSSGLIIYISVENEDPELAIEIANTLVANSIEIADDEEQGFDLLQNKLKVLDVADVAKQSSPNEILNVVISILLGGIIALAFVFIRELFNNKFQTPSEMEKYLGIKVIAAVPGTIKERRLVD